MLPLNCAFFSFEVPFPACMSLYFQDLVETQASQKLREDILLTYNDGECYMQETESNVAGMLNMHEASEARKHRFGGALIHLNNACVHRLIVKRG